MVLREQPRFSRLRDRGRMKLKGLAQTAAMLVMLGAVTPVLAASIPIVNVTVDGNLSDWGVTLLNNNGSNLQPKTMAPGASSSLCTTPASAVWACEDTNDNATTFDATGGLVGPSWGGQDYDVEFLGTARGTGVNSNKLFVGIASGFPPDNGSNLYGPGDLFVKVNGIAYVIELGGGAGHTGGATPAQTQGADGSYYTLDSNGYTTSATSLPGQIVGSIWKVADGTTTQTAWAAGPTQWLKGASAVSLGTATVYSTLDSLTGTQNQHAVIELGIDLGLFPAGIGPTTSIDLVWDPACFNDVLSISGTTPVPEPATMFLGGLGLIAFGYAARRRLFGRQHYAKKRTGCSEESCGGPDGMSHVPTIGSSISA